MNDGSGARHRPTCGSVEGAFIFGANGLRKLLPVSQPNMRASHGCDATLATSYHMWVRDGGNKG